MSDLEALLGTWAEKFRPHPQGAGLPPHHDDCLGCGPDNPHGHHLQVRRDGEGVVAVHTFDDRHVGAPGIVHGGAVATVIDDLYGFLFYLVGGPAVTRQLTVDYLGPVLIGTPYEIEAHVLERDGRKLFVNARVTDPDGRAVVTSKAVFITVGVEHFTGDRTRGALEE